MESDKVSFDIISMVAVGEVRSVRSHDEVPHFWNVVRVCVDGSVVEIGSYGDHETAKAVKVALRKERGLALA